MKDGNFYRSIWWGPFAALFDDYYDAREWLSWEFVNREHPRGVTLCDEVEAARHIGRTPLDDYYLTQVEIDRHLADAFQVALEAVSQE